MNPPPPPPPPPPHGQNASNRNGLPDGNYDIFVIPPHSAGGGFIYLPSLQPHPNSFLAGVACTLLGVTFYIIVLPVFKEWFSTIVAGGGTSVLILLLAVGIAGWAWGKTQIQAGGSGHRGPGGAPNAHMPGYSAGGSNTGPTPGFNPGPNPGYTPGSGFAQGPNPGFAPNSGFTPGPGFTPGFTPPPEPRPPPKSTWQRPNPTSSSGAAKGGWEKAREETRKKEEERKKAEDLRKKREEDEKERVQQREKDAREREIREARENREKERAQERTQERAQERTQERAQERARPASPTKGHRHPTAKTATDDDAYSYRPYDEPKRSTKTATASSIYSESSYAASQSTSRTTPPPSHRGPYRCKDPDKIVLKAVYSFNNTFTKVPISKLVSGVGAVTDGLILRITTEGLFIDDDVRGVPQREWDVKAWTLKLVEVWCPHLHALGPTSGSTPASCKTPNGSSGFFGKNWTSKVPTVEESNSFLEASLRACKPSLSSTRIRSDSSCVSQSGTFKGLHVLRASIRDQEGKRYVFVLQEEEGWKVSVGLQRLRRGTQVRALGVSGMAVNETKAILENMGWI